MPKRYVFQFFMNRHFHFSKFIHIFHDFSTFAFVWTSSKNLNNFRVRRIRRTRWSSQDSDMNKTYENYGNKSHQTTANNAQLATIIHLKINRDMLSSISNKIVIFDFHVISNDCEPDGPYFRPAIPEIIRTPDTHPRWWGRRRPMEPWLSDQYSLYCSENAIRLTNYLKF